MKMVSSFLSFDENKSKRVIDFSQQPQNEALSENSDEESVHSTLRKRYVSSQLRQFITTRIILLF